MNTTLLVAKREFLQRVRTRSFVLMSISVPLILILIAAFSGRALTWTSGGPAASPIPGEQPGMAVGYVDQAGLIRSLPEDIPAALFQAYADAATADEALLAGDIGAYYVVAPDYRDTGNVRRVSLRLPVVAADVQWLNRLLATNLLPDAGPEQIARLRRPFGGSAPEFVALSPADAEEPSRGSDGGIRMSIPMMPMLVTIAIIMPLFTSGALLLQSVTQEKSSRIMEILLVSLRPHQLLTGKLLGLGGLTVVQYAIWAAIALVGFAAIGQDVSQFLGGINLSAGELLLVVPFALGGFALYAGLMAGIGALAPDMENSRNWVFVVSLPMLIPIYLWVAIVTAPNGPVAVALSLLPFSAPIAMMMRLTSTAVPAWQIGVSLALLFATGLGMIRLIARLFRVQTLLSGEALSLRRVWATLRG